MTTDPTGYRARQTVVAVGLSVAGLAAAGWLLVKAFAEISGAVAWPRGAR